jgi:hypothetical protein
MYPNIRVQTAQDAVAVSAICGANNKTEMKMNEETTRKRLPFAQIRCNGYPGPTEESGRHMLGYPTRLQKEIQC